MDYNDYKRMWILAMFDLPTDTKRARKAYALFRKKLLKDGFDMLQYSVYARHCSSKDNADVHIQRISRAVPSDGEVRILAVTEKQFARMSVFWGKRRKMPEQAPNQLELF